MVTFNFADPTTSLRILYQYTGSTISPGQFAGNSTITIYTVQSNETDPSVPGGSITFTVSANSQYFESFYDATFDKFDFWVGRSFTASGSQTLVTASHTLRFETASGQTQLSSAVAAFMGRVNGEDAVWLLASGGTEAVGGGPASGLVNGIRFTVNPAGEVFSLTSLTGTPVCFAKDTQIATPGGEVAVQDLSAGDRVLTADGEAKEVLWVGRQSFDTRMGVPPNLRLVRIQAGALGDGLPRRDLEVTADHGIVLDGLVINAAALVNGTTIGWVPPREAGNQITIYHVETEGHDVILAEGAPTETFIDYLGRRAFDNYAEYMALYGEERVIPEMAHPRISSARLLPDAIRCKLGGAKGQASSGGPGWSRVVSHQREHAL